MKNKSGTPDYRMIIAGGGTGGHLFPGIAIAEEFLKRDGRNAVLFIGTERGLEKKVLGELGYVLRILDVEGIKGRGRTEAVKAALKIPKSLLQSLKIIREFRPDIVMGVGGYASGPCVMMAWMQGIKTAVAEQNVVPGVTNQILGKFVDKIFVTFPDTKKWFSDKKVLVSGNPVRKAFLAGQEEKQKVTGRFNILIFGGSQGAHAINTACVNALDDLENMKNQLYFVHQTGQEDWEMVSDAYHKRGFSADVRSFIMDMPAAYQAADLLICRAGATSIAEMTVCGKAAILIPFPFAIHNHQTKNAEVLVGAKAAEMISQDRLNGKALARMIETFKNSPERIREMEANSRAIGNRQAAADIVDACLRLIKE
ncbi:MAG: undecaprenyldiphospho-muramoylpentapeptide beta-N-acetylglucosaminyltransferase [Deltaproteobacteria bacterium]|nr:undecaprenyldiphospho-muramoylpentapeptide beta-N-acetylglucosaminyltransferase [Deltaproteobacteria bacterium]